MSEIRTFGFQHIQISDIGIFGTHTKGSDFSIFGFQTVSEIGTFKCLPLAFKWLATGFFGFVLTLPHLVSLNK